MSLRHPLRQLGSEASRFLLVGGVNFFLTLVLFTALLKVAGLHYLLALFAAWLAGMVFSYVANFTWVFRTQRPLQFRTAFFKFAAANLLSVSLNMLALRFLVERTGHDPFFVQLALIPLIVIFNFTTAKFWSLS